MECTVGMAKLTRPRLFQTLPRERLFQRLDESRTRKAVWVTSFQCDTCGTRWRHVDDHADKQAGWSIEEESG